MSVLLLLLSPFLLPAQGKILRGKSEARSGMLYYDHKSATDMVARTYIYTICPDSAACVWLDFNLIELPGVESEAIQQTFIQVYSGTDTTAPLLASLPQPGRNMLLQSTGNCLTVRFKREGVALRSAWTAQWRGMRQDACIHPNLPSPCNAVQDVCGPSFVETRPTLPKGPTGYKPAPNNHHDRWYRFAIAQDGPLEFDIIPQDPAADLDWALFRGDTAHPEQCDFSNDSTIVARNVAAGAGPNGATGMDTRGQVTSNLGDDCPYNSPLQVRRGEIYFLRISARMPAHMTYELQLGEVVLQCQNPPTCLLPIAQKPLPIAPKIDPRRTFLSHSQVWRLDLRERANRPLSDTDAPSTLLATKGLGIKPEMASLPLDECKGLPSLLVRALQHGAIQATAAHDFRTPVTYGDLLEFVRRQRGTAPQGNWWELSPDEMAGLQLAVEFIMEDRVDNMGGHSQPILRYVRLLWTDLEGKAPDYNLLVFKMEDLRPLLEAVPVHNRLNEASTSTLLDLIENRQYQGILIAQSGNKHGNLSTSGQVTAANVQMKDFLWEK